jgi:hypothetical protein
MTPPFCLIQLRGELSPDGKAAVAILAARDMQAAMGARIYLHRNFAFDGKPPESWFQVGALRAFAFHGALTNAFPATSQPVTIAIKTPAVEGLVIHAGMQLELDGPDLIFPELTDFDALYGGLLLFVGSEIMSIAAADLLKRGKFVLTVIRNFAGTQISDHPAGADCFILPRAGLRPIQHPHIRAGNLIRMKIALDNMPVGAGPIVELLVI